MVEIIGTVYIIFFTLSWIAGLTFLNFSIRKKFHSQGITNLNSNLAKMGLFWSNRNANFQSLEEGNPENDYQSMRSSFLLMTTVLSLLSGIGFILLILMMFTGRPRRETRTFHSDLAKNPNLSLTEIEEQVAYLKNIY